MARPFSIAARIRSFRFAAAGIARMIRTQHNAWLHLLATIVVVGLGIGLQVGRDDWRWLVVAISTVWTAEAVNTAFEHVCDVVSPAYHPAVERAKDVAAGAVLVAALAALVLGLLTLLPYLRA
jgi:diacylglycerol kinase (ATP)